VTNRRPVGLPARTEAINQDRAAGGLLSWFRFPTSRAELASRLVVASGLAVDAYVHADLAHTYAEVTGGIGEANLFRINAVVAAIVAAAALLIGGRVANAAAFGLAISAAVLAVVATYVSVGPFGPIPNLYDPVWYTEKAVSVAAEVFAAMGAIAGLLVLIRRRRRGPNMP
jgi:hypothetical protein